MTEGNRLFPYVEDNAGNNPKLVVELGDIRLNNPVVMCSGTFGYGEEYHNFYDTSLLGGVTTKSYSLKPRDGNSPPRICETMGGMLNSIGLQNDGIDKFIRNHLPRAEKLGLKIILSIFGQDLEEFNMLAYKISDIKKKIIAVELNLSCPNVERGGMAFSTRPSEVKKIVKSVVQILKFPVIAKLSPNQHNLIEAAKAAEKGGAEAVSIINTLLGMAIDIETFKPKLASVTGGLSGPAIKPVALASVYSLSREKILPVIGMGGIFSTEDALEFLVAGASAIGIGTANFVQYDIGKRILDGLIDYLKNKKIHDINEIIGKLKI